MGTGVAEEVKDSDKASNTMLRCYLDTRPLSCVSRRMVADGSAHKLSNVYEPGGEDIVDAEASGDITRTIAYHNYPDTSSQLLSEFFPFADDWSGKSSSIPSSLEGVKSESSGTAFGDYTNTLASTQNMQDVVFGIDQEIMAPMVKYIFNWAKENRDEDILEDVEVYVKGSNRFENKVVKVAALMDIMAQFSNIPKAEANLDYRKIQSRLLTLRGFSPDDLLLSEEDANLSQENEQLKVQMEEASQVIEELSGELEAVDGDLERENIKAQAALQVALLKEQSKSGQIESSNQWRNAMNDKNNALKKQLASQEATIKMVLKKIEVLAKHSETKNNTGTTENKEEVGS